MNTINGGTNVDFFRELRSAGRVCRGRPDPVGQHHGERSARAEPGGARGRLPGRQLLPEHRPAREPRIHAASSRERFGQDRVTSDPAGRGILRRASVGEGGREGGRQLDAAAVADACRGHGVRWPAGEREDRRREPARLASGAHRANSRRTGRSMLVPGAGSKKPIRPDPVPDDANARTKWERVLATTSTFEMGRQVAAAEQEITGPACV